MGGVEMCIVLSDWLILSLEVLMIREATETTLINKSLLLTSLYYRHYLN